MYRLLQIKLVQCPIATCYRVNFSQDQQGGGEGGDRLDPAFMLAWEPPSLPHIVSSWQIDEQNGDDDDFYGDDDDDVLGDDDEMEAKMEPDGAISPLQFLVYPQNDDRCSDSTCS